MTTFALKVMGNSPVRLAWFAKIAVGSIFVGAFGRVGAMETRFEERWEERLGSGASAMIY